MKLKELFSRAGIRAKHLPCPDSEIRGISYNSKKVIAGGLFFAVAGMHFDGLDFAPEALKRGAAAVVSNRPASVKNLVLVDDVKLALAKISEAFYGFPSKKVDLVGITGTNGKTTVTYFLDSIFRAAGIPSAVFGSINYRWKNFSQAFANTTAESADISENLSRFVADGGKAVFLEVTSQGLDRKCADALTFRGGIFTNLSREHLDWHGTIENYAMAKRKLFEIVSGNPRGNSFILTNINDEWGLKIAGGLGLTPDTFAIGKKAEFSASRVNITPGGTDFIVSHPAGKTKISIRLPGLFNVSNALAAFAAAAKMGVSMDSIKKGIESLTDVPGRMSKISSHRGFSVYVDYAHTPDALEKALKALKPICEGRLICVFGCGGNRDRGKRPVMGEIAAKISDFVWITSDNPREENAADIALDIEVGARIAGGNYRVETDRSKAVEGAVRMAGKGDIILLAGKGHEDYQIIGRQKIPYSDFEAAKKAIEKLKNQSKI